jgi:hypothetical protein
MRLIDILEQNSENIYTVSCNKITEPLIKEFLINEVCKKSKINFINNFNFNLKVAKFGIGDIKSTLLSFSCSGDDGVKNGMIYLETLSFNLNDFLIFFRDYKLSLIIN